jgi:hypothetical protein
VSGPIGPTSQLRKLDASVGASGPHDFAVRISAARPRKVFALRRCRVHRIPHPTSVTTAKRPSCEAGQAYFGFDLGSRSTVPIATDWHDGQIVRSSMPFPPCDRPSRCSHGLGCELINLECRRMSALVRILLQKSVEGFREQ